jgi:hypothetical protein
MRRCSPSQRCGGDPRLAVTDGWSLSYCRTTAMSNDSLFAASTKPKLPVDLLFVSRFSQSWGDELFRLTLANFPCYYSFSMVDYALRAPGSMKDEQPPAAPPTIPLRQPLSSHSAIIESMNSSPAPQRSLTSNQTNQTHPNLIMRRQLHSLDPSIGSLCQCVPSLARTRSAEEIEEKENVNKIPSIRNFWL